MMKNIKRILFWYYILNKRMLKKISYLVILLLIPLLTFMITTSSHGESGFLTIALAAEEPDDPTAQRIIDRIDNDSQVIQYIHCDSVEDAESSVKTGKANFAWIINENIQKKIKNVTSGSSGKLVRVVATDDDTILKISGEKLFGDIYLDLAYSIYENHVDSLPLPEGSVTEHKLREYYTYFNTDGGLFEFEYLDSSRVDVSEMNYLTSPLRGLMMTVMLLCGFAGVLYFLSDEKKRVFSNLSTGNRILIFFGNNLAALSISGVFVTVALILSNNYTSFIYETILMILYILATTGFCTLLGTIFGSPNKISLCLPIGLVLSIALCPVFFNVRQFVVIQKMLPLHYYMYGVNDSSMIPQVFLYIIVTFALSYFLYWLRYRNGERR